MFGVVLKRGNNVTIYLSFRDVGNCKGSDKKSKMILLYNNILDVGCDVCFFLTFCLLFCSKNSNECPLEYQIHENNDAD